MKIKERPILFSPLMAGKVAAVVKTQTRRIVKPQPPHSCMYYINGDQTTAVCVGPQNQFVPPFVDRADCFVRCPYGQPGDRLWVREAWRYEDWTEDGEPFIGYRDGERRLCKPTEEWCDRTQDIWAELSARGSPASDRGFRPSIHMPRWACRTVLEITSVRVERVRDISEADALAEGITSRLVRNTTVPTRRVFGLGVDGDYAETGRAAFLDLFYYINKRADPGANPWVWVIEFRKV